MNFIINSIVTSSLVVVVHRTLEIAKKTNFNKSLLQIRAKLNHKLGIFYYQLGQVLLQNWGSFILLQIGASVITNWGSFFYYKLGQFSYYKSGQVFLQIRATITNWGSYYKLEQTLLQISAAITNWGIAIPRYVKTINIIFGGQHVLQISVQIPYLKIF